MTKLTTKQKLFVEAYIANPNGTEAARKAGYAGNDNTLASMAKENLRKPQILKLIEKRIEKEAMTSDEVLNELADIAKSDWREHQIVKYDKDGNEVSATFLLKDKLKALELLGKFHKLFTDKVELGGKVQLETNTIKPKVENEQ